MILRISKWMTNHIVTSVREDIGDPAQESRMGMAETGIIN